MEVVQHEKNFLGSKYKVTISGTKKQIWVRPTDLSDGVVESYTKEAKLPRAAKARVKSAHSLRGSEKVFPRKQVRTTCTTDR